MRRWLDPEECLESEVRRQIFAVVEENPGIRQIEIAETFGWSPATVMWHMNKLVAANLIWSENFRNQRIFHVVEGGAVVRDLGRQQAVLRETVPGEVFPYYLEKEALCTTFVAQRVNRSRPMVERALVALSDTRLVTSFEGDIPAHAKWCQKRCKPHILVGAK